MKRDDSAGLRRIRSKTIDQHKGDLGLPAVFFPDRCNRPYWMQVN